MAESTQVLFNTMEQVLSADLNRAQALVGKHVQDMQLGLLAGVSTGLTPPDLVIRGLDLQAGVGMSVDLEAGLLLRFEAAPAADQSQYRIGVLPTNTNLGIAAADPVNPRIDLISAVEGDVDSDNQVRNVLTLPSRTVVPTPVDKTRTPQLTLFVTTGVAGAIPAIPATPAGEVPLWYVYVPAAAVGLTNDNLVDVRRYAKPASLIYETRIETGLRLVAGLGGAGIELGAGKGLARGAPFTTPGQVLVFADTVEVGGGALAADQVWHLYAIARGAGLPVGRGVADNVVIVASQTVPAAGIPSAPINYRVFANATFPFNATASEALYLGSMRTDALGSFETDGNGVPLDPSNEADPPVLYMPPADFRGWIRRPQLSWVDAATLTVGDCAFFHPSGVPAAFAAANGTMAANLATGEVEAASTWYYVYLRTRQPYPAAGAGGRVPSRTFEIVISAEAPDGTGGKPTPEAGGFLSSDYRYVGCAFNGATSNLRNFRREGNTYVYVDETGPLLHFADVAVTPAKTTVLVDEAGGQNACPDTTRLVILAVACELYAEVNEASAWFALYAGTGLTNPLFQTQVLYAGPGGLGAGVAGAQWWQHSEFTLHMPVDQAAPAIPQFELNRRAIAGLGANPAALMSVRMIGWVESEF